MIEQWCRFNHRGLRLHLRAIVDGARTLGAQVDSCGEGKVTLHWPDGESVHVRRFGHGPYRWLIFTASGYRALVLARRDPSIRELRTALQDPPTTNVDPVSSAGEPA